MAAESRESPAVTSAATPANERSGPSKGSKPIESTADVVKAEVAARTNRVVKAAAEEDWRTLCSMYDPEWFVDSGGVDGCVQEITTTQLLPQAWTEWAEYMRPTPAQPIHVHVTKDSATVKLADVTGQENPDSITFVRQDDEWMIGLESSFPTMMTVEQLIAAASPQASLSMTS